MIVAERERFIHYTHTGFRPTRPPALRRPPFSFTSVVLTETSEIYNNNSSFPYEKLGSVIFCCVTREYTKNVETCTQPTSLPRTASFSSHTQRTTLVY